MRLTRRERIKLLLRSLVDAREAGHGRLERGSAPGSRPPLRNLDLWPHGSYAQLEKALDLLRERCPSKHWHTEQFYIYGINDRRIRRVKAELGVECLMRYMSREVFVPQEVAEWAGFMASEAKAAAKPRVMAT